MEHKCLTVGLTVKSLSLIHNHSMALLTEQHMYFTLLVTSPITSVINSSKSYHLQSRLNYCIREALNIMENYIYNGEGHFELFRHFFPSFHYYLLYFLNSICKEMIISSWFLASISLSYCYQWLLKKRSTDPKQILPPFLHVCRNHHHLLGQHSYSLFHEKCHFLGATCRDF